MVDVIDGRVAQIIGEREVIINRGQKDGVSRGMIFDVLRGDQPVQVTDPETGESLGACERTKTSIVVAESYDRFAVCEPVARLSVGESRVAPHGFFSPGKRTPESGRPELQGESRSSEETMAVKVGNRVRLAAQNGRMPARSTREARFSI